MKKNHLIPHVIKDTNTNVFIRKVSPFLLNEVSKQFPQPDPPENIVDYGDGKKVSEPNPSDPEYKLKLNKWNQDVSFATQELMIERGVEIELGEDEKKEVADLRAYWIEKFNKKLEGGDKFIYVTMIAIGTDKDLEDLLIAITRRSQPTEEAIKLSTDFSAPATKEKT
jgi:hypothetical protein